MKYEIKKVKVKKLSHNNFNVKVVTKRGKDKGWGDLYIRTCAECGEVYVTSDTKDCLCGICKNRIKTELKDLFTSFKGLMGSLLGNKKHNRKDKDVKNETSKKDTVVDTTSDTATDTVNEHKKDRLFNWGNAAEFCKKHPSKIKMPKFGEKYNFLLKKYKYPVGIEIARKLLEYVARKVEAEDIAEEMNVKLITVKTYLSQLSSCGLIVPVRKDNGKYYYIINPAIYYYLDE